MGGYQTAPLGTDAQIAAAVAYAKTLPVNQGSGYSQTGGESQNYTAPDGSLVSQYGADSGASLAQLLQNNGSILGNAYNWGGTPGAAAADINAANAGAADAESRTAPQADYTQANLAAALQGQAMGSQQDALGMYKQMANGQLPSAAQAGFAQAISAQQAAQASAAASARGGGLARAAVQRQAMQQSAATGQQNAAAFAGQRANEINAGIQGYSGLATSMGAQDIAAQTEDANQANEQANLKMQQGALNDAQNQSYRTQAMNIGNAAMQGAEAKNGAIMSGLGMNQQNNQFNSAQNTSQNNSLIAGGVSAGTALLGLGAIAMSDRRAKKDIKPAGRNIEDFVKALQARDYEYKDTKQTGAKPGRHTSVMAQDLEKSEIGRRMVIDTPQGKMVDYKEGFAAAIAALPWLNQKIDSQKVDIEALKKAFSSKHARESAHA